MYANVMSFCFFVFSCTAEMQTPSGLYALPHPDGLTTEEAYQLLRSPTNEVAVLPQIPKGNKRNVYCLIDNSENQKRRTIGHRSIFDDDCGPWQSSKCSCVTSPYIVDGQNGLRRIFWIGSQQAYCSELKVDRKRVYSPLDPQPSPDTVIKIKRYYTTLAVNDDYKRRITTLVEPNVLADHTVAIVEYFDHNVVDAIYDHSRDETCGSPSMMTSNGESMEEAGDSFENNGRCAGHVTHYMFLLYILGLNIIRTCCN